MSTNLIERRTDVLGVHRPHVTPTGVEPVDAAGAAWVAEYTEYKAVDAEFRELTAGSRARGQAERADASAFAQARLAHKPDPGPKAVQALNARIEDLGRRRMGLAAACAELKSRYHAQHAEHAAAVAADRDRRIVEGRAAATPAVDLLETVLTKLAAAHAHAMWIDSGATRALDKSRVTINVRGETVQLGHIIAALHEHIARPAVSEQTAATFLEPATATVARPIGAQRGTTPPDAA